METDASLVWGAVSSTRRQNVLLLLLIMVTAASNAPAQDQCYFGTQTLDVEEAAFLTLINAHRSQHGAPTLEPSRILTNAAKWHSNDMATRNYFSHDDSLGRDPFQRMAQCGYPATGTRGENIAAGVTTAAEAFALWQSSSGHNVNMLHVSFNAIGIGRAHNPNSTYGWYWTTDFGEVVDAPVGDSIPPNVLITSPPSHALLSGPAVGIGAGAWDNVGVAGVQFLVNNQLLGPEDQSPPYSVEWNTVSGPHSVPNGTHTLTAIARDTSNLQASTSIVVSVQNSGVVTTTSSSTTTTVTTTTSTTSTTTTTTSTTTTTLHAAIPELRPQIQLTASQRSRRVTLRWTLRDIPGWVSVQVYRGTCADCMRYVKSVRASAADFRTEKLRERRYYFRIRALMPDGSGVWSDTVAVRVR